MPTAADTIELSVVGEPKFTQRSAEVTIQGPTQDSVRSADARNLAIATARAQLGRCGTSGTESSYPVDADGNTSDDLLMGRGQVAAYRCDYKLTASL